MSTRNSAQMDGAGPPDPDSVNPGFGASDLARKRQIMEDNYQADAGELVGELTETLMRFLREELPAGTAKAYKVAKTAITPGFIKRRNAKIVHQQNVEERDSKINNLSYHTKTTIARELSAKKAQRQQDKIIRELIEARRHLKEEAKEVLHKAEVKNVEEEFRKFHARREAQMAEAQAKKEQERQDERDQEENDAIEHRKWRIGFYSDQADKYATEIANRSEDEMRRLRNDKLLNRTFDEWKGRDEGRTRLQVEGIPQSKPIGLPGMELSIFGKEHSEVIREEQMHRRDPDTWHDISTGSEQRGEIGSRQADDLFLEEVDQHDAFVFTSDPHTSFEDARIVSDDIETNLQRQQSLYDALQHDSSNLKQAIEKMLDMKEQLERDLHQVNNEILVIDKAQTGPPRRMPMSWEIPEMDNWKTQSSRLNKRIGDLQYAIDKAQERKNCADSQSTHLAKGIAVIQQDLKSHRSDMDDINGKQGLLPMVIGRSLSKVPGMGVTANPRETMLAVTHQSRLINIKSGSDQAALLHKEKDAIEQEIWLNRVDETSRKLDLERMISRIAKISDKLQRAGIDNMRVNIIDSLKAFLLSTHSLNQVHSKLVGVLPWYKHHDFKQSLGVKRYIASCPMGGISFEKGSTGDDDGEEDEVDKANADLLSNGVTLGPYKEGYCCGTVELPKDCLWNIVITVSRQGYGEQYDSGNAQDFVTVKLGPTISSVGVIGTYFNAVNPVTGSVLYDVKHVFRGKSFAFRFDFSSSSDTPEHHLCVSSGLYEEFELQAIEEVNDPKIPGRKRVLSSYVKMLRIEERTGRLRETKLLEELIAVEYSKLDYWDSDLVTSVMQRYSKEYFLRILKAEILLQQQEAAAQRAKQLEEQAKVRALIVSSDMEREAAMEHSKKQYQMKKRAAQRKVLDNARELLKKRIILWDDLKSQWRNLTVLDYVVTWVENGMQAKVFHLVQEYDDANNKIAEPKQVDLSSFKYFESPQQEIDAETVQKWRERKAWRESMEKIDNDVNKRVSKLRKSLGKFTREQEKQFRKSKANVFNVFESTVDEKAWETADKPVSKRALKVMYHKVMIDFKKGLVTLDETKNLKEEGRRVAKDRFVAEWIETRRKELVDQFDENEVELKEFLDNKTQEVEDACAALLRKAAFDKEEFKNYIRKQLAEKKKVLLRQVKFPAEVFQLAVPTAYNCEHMKTKAWGNNYGKGVKCQVCGLELSNLDKAESQILGYGSGADPALVEAVTRHRENEQSFRFKSAEELALVESERIRLEKERRVMEEQEMFFYDFEDLPVIYDFDRRHQRELKAAGLFRQGLQWKEEELTMFQLSKITREKERLAKLGLPESLLEDFDPLSEVAEPAPTFREIDERHRAQYKQMSYSIGRLHNFNKRIHSYKIERFVLLSDLDMYSKILESLHKESYLFEHELNNIERDLDRTSKLMRTYESMQKLWQQASLIRNQAQRDKAKAEMRTVGLVDDVKEAFDKHAILHDETRNLLRLKLLTDAKLDRQETIVRIRQDRMKECQKEYDEAERKAAALRYCMPGNLVHTRFGQLYITAFRPEDDMVMVVLPFGNPRAKAYLYYKEIVETERARQQAERLLMEQEDETMLRFVAVERINAKKERYLMQKAEEGLKRYYEFVDLGKNEDKVVKKSIDAAVGEAFEVTESRKFQDIHVKTVKQQLKNEVIESKRRVSEYIGPPTGRPKALSTWQRHKLRKQIDSELKAKFIKAAATKADAQAKAVLLQTRSSWVQSYSFEVLINTVISEMIYEVAGEAFVEGKVAKGFAEKRSGIMFPQPTWMQYGTYASLSAIWRRRKEDLEKQIAVNKGETSKIMAADPLYRAKKNLSMDPEDVKRRKIDARRKKLELIRQQRLCGEMQQEEIIARDFYRWELKVNLSERRQMRVEDDMAKSMRKDEQDRILAEQQAYELMGGSAAGATGAGAGAAGGRPHLTAGQKAEALAKGDRSYERRRIELKELTLERRKKEEDRALMTLEDEASRFLRDIDRAERQKKLMKSQFGDAEGDDVDGGQDPEENRESVEWLERFVKLNPRKVLPIPKWLKVPKGFNKWLTSQKNEYIRMMILIHAKQKRIDKHVERDERRLIVMEDKSRTAWESNVKVAQQLEMEAELSLMESEEALKEQESNLLDVKENMRRVLNFCREKGEAELHCLSDLRKRQALVRKRDEELEEANAWLELCIRRGKNRDKLKRRVTTDCKWVDTDSINGFHQRFATELLRERLYMTYFRQILGAILNRSEIIATERRLLALQEKLSMNKAKLVERKKLMSTLLGDIRREERMRMRRSMLNEKFFGRSRREVLKQRFGGWVRFFLWNRGHREAYELQYEVIKRQLDIDRQFKKQLRDSAASDATKANNGKATSGGGGTDGAIRTIMQKHRERAVQCRNCRKFYLESQNTSMMCSYHPRQFIMECPASCPSPGLTLLCASHRLRRWTCCDAIKQDAPGCSRRYHCPPQSDPVYDKIMEKVNQRDKEELEQLEVDVQEARKHHWPERMHAAKRNRVFAIEDELRKDRATAARFSSLKFV